MRESLRYDCFERRVWVGLRDGVLLHPRSAACAVVSIGRFVLGGG